MTYARSIQCNMVRLAVGMSRRGSLDILLLPSLFGKPLLPGPIAMDVATARKIGAELLRMADAAVSSRRPMAVPQRTIISQGADGEAHAGT
jgi:hypothetical protein